MKLLLLIISFITATYGFGQKYAISGLIKDGNTGNPISFVSVQGGRGNGTAAIASGEFWLVAKKGDTLLFTCVGYTSYKYVVQKTGLLGIELKRQPCVVWGSYSYRSTSFTTPFVIDGKITERLSDDTIPASKPPNPGERIEEEEIKIFSKVEIAPTIINTDTTGFTRILTSDSKVKGKRSGMLKLGFTVNRASLVSGVTALVSFTKEIDAQVIKNLITKIQWDPAYQNGKKVNAYCELSFDVKVKKRTLTLTLLHE